MDSREKVLSEMGYDFFVDKVAGFYSPMGLIYPYVCYKNIGGFRIEVTSYNYKNYPIWGKVTFRIKGLDGTSFAITLKKEGIVIEHKNVVLSWS